MGIYSEVVIKVQDPNDMDLRTKILKVLNGNKIPCQIDGDSYAGLIFNYRTTGQENPTSYYVKIMRQLQEAGAPNGYCMIITERKPAMLIEFDKERFFVFRFDAPGIADVSKHYEEE